MKRFNLKAQSLILAGILAVASAAYADNGNCKSDGIIKNLDGTFTILHPQLLRGDQALPIESAVGVCSLFGFDSTLLDQAVWIPRNEYGAFLNPDGSFSTVNKKAGNVIFYSVDGHVDAKALVHDGIILKRLPQ